MKNNIVLKLNGIIELICHKKPPQQLSKLVHVNETGLLIQAAIENIILRGHESLQFFFQ
jgi:hypothetical protein